MPDFGGGKKKSNWHPLGELERIVSSKNKGRAWIQGFCLLQSSIVSETKLENNLASTIYFGKGATRKVF